MQLVQIRRNRAQTVNWKSGWGGSHKRYDVYIVKYVHESLFWVITKRGL